MGPESHCSLLAYRYINIWKELLKIRAFYSNCRTLLWFKTLRAHPRAKQRSENPIPGATKMCKSLGSPGGGGMVRLGIDWYINLQYTLYCNLCSNCLPSWTVCMISWKSPAFTKPVMSYSLPFLFISNDQYRKQSNFLFKTVTFSSWELLQFVWDYGHLSDYAPDRPYIAKPMF